MKAIAIDCNSILKNSRDTYAICYNSKKWRRSNRDEKDSDAEFFLEHVNGDGYALAVYERIEFPLGALKKLAIKSLEEDASDEVEILSEEKFNMNGHDALQLEMRGRFYDVKFRLYGYYVTGEWGSLQFVTFTANNLFDEYSNDFIELLNGLKIIHADTQVNI